MTSQQIRELWRALTSRNCQTARLLASMRPLKIVTDGNGSGQVMVAHLPAGSDIRPERAAMYLHLITHKAGWHGARVYIGAGAGRKAGYADQGTAHGRQQMENELRDSTMV